MSKTNVVNFERTFIAISKTMVIDILDMLDEKRAEMYNEHQMINPEWRNIILSLKTEDDDKYYDLFYEFCKNANTFDTNKIAHEWNSTKRKKNCIYSYNSLLYWASADNEKEYIKFCKKHNIFQQEEPDKKCPFEIDISQDYLLMERKLTNCKVSTGVKNFFKDDKIKGLMIESPYNTGKTTFLSKICDGFERILFISYRITLSNNLLGTFKDLGFVSYSENIDADRMICQVDSLHKIDDLKYDLVIIDESESVLNHYISSSLKNPYQTFQLMSAICFNAKKVIALDGDLNNRTKTFINGFGQSFFIKNKIQKDKMHYKFYSSKNTYDALIEEDLKKKKNICIVSMSEQLANEYYDKYSEKYQTIKYTSKTGDEQKKLLCDVKAIWGQYQLVIYSPCIESGVDYDIEHFDKIYCVMSAGSTSQRGLNQMLKRVRKVKDNTINCFLNTFKPIIETDANYTFEEVKAFYQTINECDIKMGLTLVDGCFQKTNHFELYDIIMMYNKVEALNKNINTFLPIFISMIEKKGHTYEIMMDKKDKKEKTENVVMKKIISSERINTEQYEELLKQQTKHNLTEQEKYKLAKHYYEKTFGKEFNDIESIKPFYNKFSMVRNAKNLINDENIYLNNSILQNKEKIIYINAIRDLLKCLNVNLQSLTAEKHHMTQEQVLNSFESVNNHIEKNKMLFHKKDKIESKKQFFGFFNSVMANFGIEIAFEKQNKKVAKKVVSTYSYHIQFYDEVKAMLKPRVKGTIAQTIEDFEQILIDDATVYTCGDILE